MKRYPLCVALFGMVFLCGANSSIAGEVAPGVTYTHYELPGPVQVFVVACDRWRPEYKLEVGWAQKKRNFTSRQTVSTIAGQYDSPPAHHVVAACNASFFGTPPSISGAAASNGEMLEHPNAGFETFLFGPARSPVICEDLSHVEGRLTFASGTTTTLYDYNRSRSTDRLVAYTPQWSAATGTTGEGVEIILTNVSYPMRGEKQVSGIVTAVKTGTASINNTIPAGGMVLSASGAIVSTLIGSISLGDRLRMKFDASAGDYNNANMAIAGVGWLVRNGAANTDNWLRHGDSFVNTRHPRTVIGWNSNYLYQVVVDGRSAQSVGMNFPELAAFLIGTLACEEALNLDGGGSSTLWVNGTVCNVPSDGSERAVANAVLLVKQDTATLFPVGDAFTATGRLPGWDDKFTYNDVISFSPASPGGDGYAIRVCDPAGGVETIRGGDLADANYEVRADIYCEYRPSLAANGYERCGIFARDNGIGGFGLTSTTYGTGNCYVLAYDSDTGRVRAGKFVNGNLADFTDANPRYFTASAWHQFRIRCADSNLQFFVDGAESANVTDTTFTRGYFGIGYHEKFATNSNMHGTRADNFQVSFVVTPPERASQPQPAHLATQVPTDAQLSWTAGDRATSHRVHFGTMAPGLYRGTQNGTTFDPGPLVAGWTYYWRIDEVNPAGTTTGDVWQFTTEPQTILADFDEDGDVDMDDFGHLQSCLTGIGTPQYDPACQDTRLDGDTDVDQSDMDALIACLSGANVTPPAECGVLTPSADPIPPRPAEAMTGSQFIAEVMYRSLADREARILQEITSGNVPDFLRDFVPVQVSATTGGTQHTLTYYVMPDYLCIGSDVDFVRMPMTPNTAQAIADKFECMLPTRKMVNDIYSQAAVKLAPSPINPSSTDITAVSTFYQHHLTIESQGAGRPLGLLIGGIKKDVVVTPQIATHPGKVAIYGWHQLNGVPIQPLYLGHVDFYVDYSHGLRMVKGYIIVDGQPVSAADVLNDGQLHVLLSDEGPMDNPRY